MFKDAPPVLEDNYGLGDLVWFSTPLRIHQGNGQLVRVTQVSAGPYRVAEDISSGIFRVRSDTTKGRVFMVNKAGLTRYTCQDELAEEMAQLAQWLESTDGLQSPGDGAVHTQLEQMLRARHCDMGEITLESDGEEPEAKRGLWPGAHCSSERDSLSWRQLPV